MLVYQEGKGKTVAKLATWIDENVPEGLTVFRLPTSHRRRLRTSNMLERLNRLLRLVTALLMEQSEDWEAGKRYLTF